MVGCGTTGTSGKAEGPVSKKENRKDSKKEDKKEDRKDSKKAAGNIPVSSKFSKISVGMSQAKMVAILGKPNQTISHPSGKQFRPFYFGHDYVHVTNKYKGEGRIELDSDGIVDEIEYDPKETGN